MILDNLDIDLQIHPDLTHPDPVYKEGIVMSISVRISMEREFLMASDITYPIMVLSDILQHENNEMSDNQYRIAKIILQIYMRFQNE